MKYFVASAIVLLVAFAACKSPFSPSYAGPTLTLLLPDSSRALDSTIFRVHYSDSINLTSVYEWQFGDSSSVQTRDTFVYHTYSNPGTYTVQVVLMDMAAHTMLAKQSAQIKVMPFIPPTLTLIAPDTDCWGDSSIMKVTSSQHMPSWKYTWSFGDSTSFSSQQNSALHWYLNPGIYTVRVELEDTVRHFWLGSKTAIVHVVARHFNLALLQSMTYVDISLNGLSQVNKCGENDPLLIWGDKTFSSSTFVDSDTEGFYWGNRVFVDISYDGTVDSLLTQITYISHITNESIHIWNTHFGQDDSCSSSTYYTTNNVPFVSSSNSEIIFEAHKDTSDVVIRFHN